MRKKTTAKLKKELWKLFSEVKRRTGADSLGFNTCYTCGTKRHWKQLHAGHYIRASAGLSTYFDEQNVKIQCYACNIWRDGNSDEYALALIKEYGPDILNDLNRKKNTIIKDFPYEKKIIEYQTKIKELPPSTWGN